MMVYQLPFSNIHFLNLTVQILFDISLVKFTGSYHPLIYLIMCSFLAGSLHPCAGHFISEHYFFSRADGGTESIAELKGKQQAQEGSDALKSLSPPETYSYYGPLNILTYNVGLHNEHHDFPAVPWTRLPKLHKIAREFYEPLPCHRSWVWVIWTFILDENVGLWCRVKRAEGGRKVGGGSAAAGSNGDDGGWKESEVQN